MRKIDDPWLTRDLAAHLVIRDSRLDLSAGQYVPALRGRLEAMRHLAATDFVELVERVRGGPPTVVAGPDRSGGRGHQRRRVLHPPRGPAARGTRF